MPGASHIIMQSPFGSFVVVWSEVHGETRIRRVLLSSPKRAAEDAFRSQYGDLPRRSTAAAAAVATDIGRFLEGGDVAFDLAVAALDDCSSFQRAVLTAEHGIPRGRVSTYGRLAARIGRAGAARAVGTALSTNPFPIIVPCHRAILSDGRPGGYQGGTEMKRALLELEGVRFTGAGRVLSPRFV